MTASLEQPPGCSVLRLASPHFSEEAIRAVEGVLRAGMLVQGEWVARFEGALAEHLAVPHVVVVSSGTAALHLALMGVGLGPGDEVIVPAFTFPATANAVVVGGGRPVLVDVQPHDLCLDVSKIESAVTPRTRAIMPVHEFGQSADMDGILAVAAKHGLEVIEDAACAFGTQYGGRPVGSLGRCGCFSFHPRKALTTGEGGAITTSDSALATRLRELRNHGIRSAIDGLDFVAAGLNYRLTEFQAALGFHQLTDFEAGIERRIHQAGIYNEQLADVAGLGLPAAIPGRRAVFQTYHVLLPHSADRAAIIAVLRQQGVESNLGAQALNCLSFFRKKYGYTPESHPVATRAFRHGLALPIGPHCTDGDVVRVATALRAALSQSQ